MAIPAAAAAAAAGRIAIPGLSGTGHSVLLVSNLIPEVSAVLTLLGFFFSFLLSLLSLSEHELG